MTISIDWGQKIIHIEKEDLTFVQSTPETWELDLDDFRLALKALESSPAGMPYPKTHNHNTETQLAGITFARMITILEPYTITFEDGQYAVNLVGANSNLADKVNLNQVSVRSQNSAGLIGGAEGIAETLLDSQISDEPEEGSVEEAIKKAMEYAKIAMLK